LVTYLYQNLSKGSNKLHILKNKKGVQKANGILRAATLKKARPGAHGRALISEEVPPLLKIAEIPIFRLKKEKVQRNDRSGIKNHYLASFDSDSIETGDGKESEKSSDSMSELGEYVEEDELIHKDVDPKKTTFRLKVRNKERRYSRLKTGKEESVSRGMGLVVKWGINME
jgi:hypothetical protein